MCLSCTNLSHGNTPGSVSPTKNRSLIDHDYNCLDELENVTAFGSFSLREKDIHMSVGSNAVKMSPDDFSHALFLTESGFFEQPTVFEEHRITSRSFPKLIPSIGARSEPPHNSIEELARSQGIQEVDIVIFSTDMADDEIVSTLSQEQHTSSDIPFVFDMDMPMEQEDSQLDLHQSQNSGQQFNLMTSTVIEEKAADYRNTKHTRRRHPAGDRNAAPIQPREWTLL